MRSHLGAEVGLIMAVSWKDEEQTDAFLFLGGGWSLEVMFNEWCSKASVASAYPIPVLESQGLLNQHLCPTLNSLITCKSRNN